MGDISSEEVEQLEKLASTLSKKANSNVKGRLYKAAQAVSPTAVAGAKAAVEDPSDNLHKVMKAVPKEDRSGVLRVLRQMKESKKEASGCASHSKPKKKAAKGLAKKAAQPLSTFQQAGMLMGGAMLAPIISQLASKGIDALSKKSPSQVRQDLQRILEVHPEIGRPEDPRVQMAYNSLVKLNPEYAEDPLIAGPLLKQIVDSRMDPTNPMSNPIVDPGIAKGLSEARKAVREGKPRNTFGDAMGTSLGQGVQMATLGGLAQPGLPEGSVFEGGYLV